MPYLVWLDTQEAVLDPLKCCLREQARLVCMSDRFHGCPKRDLCERRATAGPGGPKLSMDFCEREHIANLTGVQLRSPPKPGQDRQHAFCLSIHNLLGAAESATTGSSDHPSRSRGPMSEKVLSRQCKTSARERAAELEALGFDEGVEALYRTITVMSRNSGQLSEHEQGDEPESASEEQRSCSPPLRAARSELEPLQLYPEPDAEPAAAACVAPIGGVPHAAMCHNPCDTFRCDTAQTPSCCPCRLGCAPESLCRATSVDRP